MASIAATHQYDVPARASSWTARWIRRLRVVLCLAEMTQQIHSLRASGVRSFQAARVVASELRTLRTSAGVLCRGAGLLSLFTGSPGDCRLPRFMPGPRLLSNLCCTLTGTVGRSREPTHLASHSLLRQYSQSLHRRAFRIHGEPDA